LRVNSVGVLKFGSVGVGRTLDLKVVLVGGHSILRTLTLQLLKKQNPPA
jgi:hypothetical protein